MRVNAIALLAVCLFASSQLAQAEDVSAGDIVNALDPHSKKAPVTRSFKRGIEVQQGTVDQGPPSINLYINFAFDSADLTSDGEISLQTLGKALSDPRLTDYSFIVAGHTDAKGTAEYNQTLSEKRAATVVSYLESRFQILPSRLKSVGYGKTKLLNSQDPEDAINRRVEIVNSSVAGQN